MRRVIRLYGIYLFVILTSCDTAGVVDPMFEDYYIKYYGSEGEQYAADILVNPDGSMILLGSSVSTISGRTAFIIKVDSKGKILWQRQCGGNDEAAADVEIIKKGARQGDLIVATNVGSESSSRIRLIRIDQNGNGIDSVLVPLHPNGSKQIVKSVTSLEIDNGFVVTGYADGALTEDTDPITPQVDKADLLALKIGDSFKVEEMTSILFQGGEKTGSAIKVFERGIINNSITYHVFGYSDRDATEPFDLNFEVIPARSGIPVNGILYGIKNEAQTVSSVLKTPSWLGEGYLMAGTSRTASGGSELYLVKLDNDLNPGLNKKIPLTQASATKRVECVAGAIAEPDGYYILANEIKEDSKHDLLLTKITYEGQVMWQRSFGSADADDTGGAIASLPDGRIAMVGTMELKTKKKMALIVTNKTGSLSN